MPATNKIAEEIPKRRGRKAKFEDNPETLDQMRRLGMIGSTQTEVAAVFGVDPQTLLNFWHRHPHHRTAFDNGREEGKASLRRKSFRLAGKNAQMNIYLRGQVLGEKPISQGIHGPGPGGSFPIFNMADLAKLAEDMSAEDRAVLIRFFEKIAAEPLTIEGEKMNRDDFTPAPATWDDEEPNDG